MSYFESMIAQLDNEASKRRASKTAKALARHMNVDDIDADFFAHDESELITLHESLTRDAAREFDYNDTVELV